MHGRAWVGEWMEMQKQSQARLLDWLFAEQREKNGMTKLLAANVQLTS